MDTTYDETIEYEEAEELEIRQEPQYRIGKMEFYLMLALAIILDGVQVLILFGLTAVSAGFGAPVAGFINRGIWFVGWLIFAVWFQLKGIRLLERAGRKIAVFFAGFLPFGLPDFTTLVIIVYMETKVADKAKFEKAMELLKAFS